MTDLVSLVGEENAAFIMGVHENTIYKWTIPTTKKDARVPAIGTQEKAAGFICLIEGGTWQIEDILNHVRNAKAKLETYA